MVWKATEEEFRRFQKTQHKAKGTKEVGGQKITTYYGDEHKEPPRHSEQRATRREMLERERDKSTPLGYVENKILGHTPITTSGRQTAGFYREKVGQVSSGARKRVAPVIKAAAPFVTDFRTMMSGPGNSHPIINMPDPSVFSGFPMNQRRPQQHKKKKGKRHHEHEDYGSPWENMMGVPEHMRQWM